MSKNNNKKKTKKENTANFINSLLQRAEKAEKKQNFKNFIKTENGRENVKRKIRPKSNIFIKKTQEKTHKFHEIYDFMR